MKEKNKNTEADPSRTAKFFATIQNQYMRLIGCGYGDTEAAAFVAANIKADKEIASANPHWKWRKAKKTVTANPLLKA